jgi:hypothetical protein
VEYPVPVWSKRKKNSNSLKHMFLFTIYAFTSLGTNYSVQRKSIITEQHLSKVKKKTKGIPVTGRGGP